MLPQRLTAMDPEAERALWRVVRRDTFATLPGLILCADVKEGLALMQVRPKVDGDLGQEEFSCGPNGLRIVLR